MTYICGGKRKDKSGKLFSCTNVSEKPSKHERPDWGYLCPACLGSQYGRAQIHIEVEETDKPNPEDNDYAILSYPVRADQDELDKEDLDKLEELDLS